MVAETGQAPYKAQVDDLQSLLQNGNAGPLPGKLFRISGWQQQSATPSMGPFVTAQVRYPRRWPPPGGHSPVPWEPGRASAQPRQLSRGGPEVRVHSVGTLNSSTHMAQKNGSLV